MKHELTASRLSYALSVAGLKPVELSEKTGVSQASISQYLSGAHAPSSKSCSEMAKILGCSPAWLIGYDVPMFEKKPEDYVDDMIKTARDSALARAMNAFKQIPPEEHERAIAMLQLFSTKEEAKAVNN